MSRYLSFTGTPLSKNAPSTFSAILFLLRSIFEIKEDFISYRKPPRSPNLIFEILDVELLRLKESRLVLSNCYLQSNLVIILDTVLVSHVVIGRQSFSWISKPGG